MFRVIDSSNSHIYFNLTQAYEAEFSNLTHEVPDENGLFKIQTSIDKEHKGYLFYDDKTPIGFIVFSMGDIHDVSEFYIIPSKRQQGYGQKLACFTFLQHPGKWQVRQIEGAEKARIFWRKVIRSIVNDEYAEDIIEDRYWGIVTRQSFKINS